MGMKLNILPTFSGAFLHGCSLDADGKLPAVFLPHEEGPVGPGHQEVLGSSSVHVPCKPSRQRGGAERILLLSISQIEDSKEQPDPSMMHDLHDLIRTCVNVLN